jgi:hypothetical protein
VIDKRAVETRNDKFERSGKGFTVVVQEAQDRVKPDAVLSGR